MKTIVFSRHSLEQMVNRGTTKEEIEVTIYHGERTLAKEGRVAFRKNFPFDSIWKGKHYQTKQVVPIVKELIDKYVVITVYVFYFGGDKKNEN